MNPFQVFSCEFYEFFQIRYYVKHLWTAASVQSNFLWNAFLVEGHSASTSVIFSLTRAYGKYGNLSVHWNVTSSNTQSVTDIFPTTGIVHFADGQGTAILKLFITEDQV